MVVNLQDNNVVVSYIQILLREQFGVTLTKTSSDSYLSDVEEDAYSITMNSPLKVTGTYNVQTYMSAALFMAFNYPNEMFPYIWYVDDLGQWHSINFDRDKLTRSLNLTLEWAYDWRAQHKYKLVAPDDLTEEVYSQIVEYDYEMCLTWDEITKYFSSDYGNTDNFFEYLNSKTRRGNDEVEFTDEDYRSVLTGVIVSNTLLSTTNRSSVELPERVLSYLFGEVVSESSELDEVIRIQKLIYSNVSPDRAGLYDEKMQEDIRAYQEDFLSKYALESGGYDLPDSYKGFKVTGYVDPWTERVITERC